MIKVLLLDCSQKLAKKLNKKGYSATSGMSGFSGVRNIPVSLYEQDVIFFNPQKNEWLAKATLENEEEHCPIKDIKFRNGSIHNKTVEVLLSDIRHFLHKRNILVVFANELYDVKNGIPVFNWIPNIFPALPTLNNEFVKQFPNEPKEEDDNPVIDDINAILGIFSHFQPKLPIKRYIKKYEDVEVYPVLKNDLNQSLSVLSYYGNYYGNFYEKGLILVFPEFDDNEKVIEYFMDYIYPQLVEKTPSLPNFIGYIEPKKIAIIKEKLDENKTKFSKAKEELEATQQALFLANNAVEKFVALNSDIQIVLGYYDDLLKNQRLAYIHAYKIADRVENCLGGRHKVSSIIGCKEDFDFIHKVANEGGRDCRHAPKKGQVIKPITPEELRRFKESAQTIMSVYINYLIEKEFDK